MFTINLLKDYPDSIPMLAEIWYHALGKVWLPDISKSDIESMYKASLREDSSLVFVAFSKDVPVGACSLKMVDAIRPELSPWLGDLVVDPAYQNQGAGKLLTDTIKSKAIELGFKKLYLHTFSKTLPDYYERQGWEYMGMDAYHNHPVTVMGFPLV